MVAPSSAVSWEIRTSVLFNSAAVRWFDIVRAWFWWATAYCRCSIASLTWSLRRWYPVAWSWVRSDMVVSHSLLVSCSPGNDWCFCVGINWSFCRTWLFPWQKIVERDRTLWRWWSSRIIDMSFMFDCWVRSMSSMSSVKVRIFSA